MELELTTQEWSALLSAVIEQEQQLTYFIEQYNECELELKVIKNVRTKLENAPCEQITLLG